MRPRLIDPGIWQDERFAPLSIDAQLLFFGIITLSDDYGKVKATESEFKMKLHPWGNYELDRLKKALRELLTVDLVVRYNTDHYFSPNWFEHQGLNYFSKSKVFDPPDSILEKYPDYAEASANARMQNKHTRKLRKINEVIDRPEGGWSIESLVEAIDTDMELLDEKFKTGLIVSLGSHYNEDLNTSQVKDYLSVMERYTDEQCKNAIHSVRKKYGTAIPFPDKVEERLKQMFGEGVSRIIRTDIANVKYLFSKAKIVEVQEFLKSLDVKRRAEVMRWVWVYLAELTGGEDNLPVVINTVYGDMDMKWERVQGIWEHVRDNASNKGDEA
jgi:hypothetical protein